MRIVKIQQDGQTGLDTSGSRAGVFCLFGLLWVIILVSASEMTRSMYYSSLAIPLLIVFIGVQIQRMSMLFPGGDDQVRLASYVSHVSGDRSIFRSYVSIYGPGILLMLYVSFLYSAYHVGITMFAKEKARNEEPLDISAYIGHFIETRYPDYNTFVSVNNGPQISFVSGKKYEQVYNVDKYEIFTQVMARTNLFILNDSLMRKTWWPQAERYLNQHFKQIAVNPYISLYERKSFDSKKGKRLKVANNQDQLSYHP